MPFATRRARVLGERDLGRLLEFLRADPVLNLFVLSRVDVAGLNPRRLGCPILGYERDGELVGACHVGANLVPITQDPAALDAFAEQIGPIRRPQSIMGQADAVLGLHERLVARWGAAWDDQREIRDRQPMLRIDGPPTVDADPRVRPIQLAEFRQYFDAAVRMYTEEVGISPLDPSNSYASYVRTLITTGRAFGAVHEGQVWFKSDIGSAIDGYCQVQGVWLDPRLRGHGLSAAAMAAAVRLCQRNFPVVSLYVNDFNIRARKLYERIGFVEHATFATVLY